MTPEVFFTRIEVVASIAFIVWFIYDRWQQMVIDVTRHELFKIRHRVFLMAADGKVAFNSSEYGEIRENFNDLIRFCHKITFPRLIAILAMSAFENRERQNITDVLARVKNDEVRRALEGQWRKAGDFLLLGMWLRSPALMAISILATPLLPVFSLVVIMDRHTYQNRYKVMRSRVERSISMEAGRQGILVPA